MGGNYEKDTFGKYITSGKQDSNHSRKLNQMRKLIYHLSDNFTYYTEQ